MVTGLARVLGRSGVESPVYTTTLPGPAQAGAARAIALDDLPAGANGAAIRFFPVRRPYRLAYSPALDRALAEDAGDHDLVHIHSLFLHPQLAAYRRARANGVPYIVSQHGALDSWLRTRGRARKWLMDRLWQRRMLEGASALHVASEGEASTIADVAPAVRRLVVPFGIDAGEYASLPPPDEFRRRYVAPVDAPVVLNLGRIAAKKGLDVLVRALARASKRAPDAVLVLAGPDDEGLRRPLADLAEREGVGSRVVFPGLLRGRARLEALAAADVWALPSHTEAFPMAVLEALAAGRPAVVTPAVNNAGELLEAEAALVRQPTPEAFADAIVSLLSDRSAAARLGTRGRAFAARYDWEALAPRWVEAYAAAARS